MCIYFPPKINDRNKKSIRKLTETKQNTLICTERTIAKSSSPKHVHKQAQHVPDTLVLDHQRSSWQCRHKQGSAAPCSFSWHGEAPLCLPLPTCQGTKGLFPVKMLKACDLLLNLHKHDNWGPFVQGFSTHKQNITNCRLYMYPFIQDKIIQFIYLFIYLSSENSSSSV